MYQEGVSFLKQMIQLVTQVQMLSMMRPFLRELPQMQTLTSMKDVAAMGITLVLPT